MGILGLCSYAPHASYHILLPQLTFLALPSIFKGKSKIHIPPPQINYPKKYFLCFIVIIEVVIRAFTSVGVKMYKIEKDAKFTQYFLNLLCISPSIIV